jgi:protein-tyrosine phosphatase
MQAVGQFLNRVVQAVQRRVRHRRILFTAREDSRKAISSVEKVCRVLVVCYGNIYRSPLVEYLLKHHPLAVDIYVRSAGFYEKERRCCVEDYQKLLVKKGYNLSGHRSKKITQEDLSWADIIVIMDRKNWDQLHQMNALALKKTVWIGAFSQGGSVEVVDPYDTDEMKTLSVIKELEQCTEDIVGMICEKRKLVKSR